MLDSARLTLLYSKNRIMHVNKDSATTHLLLALPKIFFALQAHENISVKAERVMGKVKQGDLVELNFLHFLTLSLIDLLNKTEGQCERTYLKEIFFWKHKDRPVKLFEETVMSKLIATKLIDSVRKEGSQQHVVTLTDKGQQLLKTVEKERRGYVEAIIASIEIDNPNYYQHLVKTFNDVAEAAWKITREGTRELLERKKSNNAERKSPSKGMRRQRLSSCGS
jgi:DNA-binding PadR family transcriptional regulator